MGTFNIDDNGTLDDYGSLSATDKVKVLVSKNSADVVMPLSFSSMMDLPEYNIAAGSMTKEDYESLKDDPNVEVEIDHAMQVLEDPRQHIDNLRRKLSENTPFGISMVLEDRDFWSKLGDPTGTIKVCVADTGYDLGHEDTPKGGDVTGTDNPEYSNDKWDQDPHGHGTHCSGTVSAIGGNNKGVVGVIPNNAGERFQLVIANSLTGRGSGSGSGILAGVTTCVENGAKVVSLSLGGYYYSSISEAFYEKLYEEQGILFVAAAGNGGNSRKLYPASYPSLMSVAAIDSNKNKASFSTFNDQVEISAPGVSIESSLPGNRYAKWSGTSMATPHVAGVAGLLWMYFPECENYQIRNVLLATTEDLGSNGCDDYYGFGVVRAKSAYELLSKSNCGGNLGVTDGNSGGCDQLEPSEITPSPSGTETFVPTSVLTNTNSEDPKTFAPTTTETVVFPPTSTESPVDNTFGPTLTESMLFAPTSTESPIGGTPTQYPTDRPPTPYPTETPPTPHPTQVPPTPEPTFTPPTPHPTQKAPTPYPTETPPTPYPTESPPTTPTSFPSLKNLGLDESPKPSETCKGHREPCETKFDCCSLRCGWKKKRCLKEK